MKVQWGSEYWTSLVLEWLKGGCLPSVPVFECHLITGQPNHLNTGQIDLILFSYVLVWYLNERSSTYNILDRPTIWYPNFKSFLFKYFQYSNSGGSISEHIPNSEHVQNLEVGWCSVLEWRSVFKWSAIFLIFSSLGRFI